MEETKKSRFDPRKLGAWLASRAGWLVLGAFAISAIGMAAPTVRIFYLGARHHSALYVFLAAAVGGGLASWRRGEEFGRSVGLLGAIAIAGAYLLDSYPSTSACERAVSAQTSIMERQERIVGNWNECLADEDSDSCSDLLAQENDLQEIEQNRRSLFNWWAENCGLPKSQ